MGQEGTVTARTYACAVDELADGDSLTVLANGAPVAVYRVGDAFYATSDSCTHEQWSLGTEGDLDGVEVTCTLHNARFDVRDGSALCFPATVNLRRYAVTVHNGQVFVHAEPGDVA